MSLRGKSPPLPSPHTHFHCCIMVTCDFSPYGDSHTRQQLIPHGIAQYYDRVTPRERIKMMASYSKKVLVSSLELGVTTQENE